MSGERREKWLHVLTIVLTLALTALLVSVLATCGPDGSSWLT
jgi:hypothetical protein